MNERQPLPSKNKRALTCLLVLSLVTPMALALGTPPVAHADNGTGNWRHLSTATEPGLLSNDVRAIAFEQDIDDEIPTLWVGTDRGLQRFDGRGWETVGPVSDSVAQADTDRLDVQTLTRDEDGNLWIGTGSGLWQRDAAGEWHSWAMENVGPRGAVNVITPLDDGRLLIATTSDDVSDLSLLDPSERPEEAWTSLNLGQVRDILVTDDVIWLATPEGVAPLDPETWSLLDDLNLYIKPDDVDLADDTHALAVQDDGKVWVGTRTGLVGVPAGDQQAPGTWDVFGRGKPGLATSAVTDLLMDDDGTLWIATDGGGLSRYDPIQERWTRYFHERDGLLSDRVRQLLLDDQGNLWAATDAGVSGLDHTWISLSPATTSSPNRIGANDIQAIWSNGKGIVWIGTDGGGVSFSIDDGINWTTLTSANSGLPDDTVLSLWGDGEGVVWIGTESGLAFWSGAGTQGVITSAHSSLPAVPIYALWGSGRDAIWAGSQDALFYSVKGVDDPKSMTWERSELEDDDSEPSRPPSPSLVVRTLWGDAAGTVWMGTNRGLWRITGGTIAEFATVGLPDFDIRVLRGAADGTILWAGTNRGLGYTNPISDSKWIAVSSDDPAGNWPSGAINALWIDDRNQIWAGSDGGLTVSQTGTDWETSTTGAVRALWGDSRGHLWAGGPNKLDHRQDWDAEWTPYATNGQGLRTSLISDLLYDRPNDTLWAATQAGLATSRDRGRTWNTDLTFAGVKTLYQTDQGTLWVGGSWGVARRQATGWEKYPLGTQETDQVNAIWVGAGPSGDTVWLGADGGLYRSDGDGATWRRQTTTPRLEGESVSALTGQGNTLWVGTAEGSLARSRNDGVTWVEVDEVVSEAIYALHVQDDQIMVATHGGLWSSDDGGDSWRRTRIADMPDNDTRVVYIHPDTKAILLGTASGGLARSHDDGETWQVVNTESGLPPVNAITSTPDGALWIATADGLARYAPRPEVQPWIQLLRISDVRESPNQLGGRVHLVSDEQLDVQFVGGSLLVRPEQVPYNIALISQKDPDLSFDPQNINPAGAGSEASFSFVPREAERLDGDYTLTIIAIDPDGRESAPRTLTVIGTDTPLERFLNRILGVARGLLLVILIITVLAAGAGWIVLWSLARTIGIPRPVLLRQGARIPFVTLGYRSYRHRWEVATPLERLLTLLAPPDRAFTAAEAGRWLQERSIPCEEETLERALEAATRDQLLRREGYGYSLAERALNRALQDHEGQTGLNALMREVRDTHPLVAEAHNLFRAAGFALEGVAQPLSFLCQPAISFWARRFEKGIYTRILPGASLDAEAVRALQQDARQTADAGSMAFVVIDTHPKDSAWDAIGELRAEDFVILPIDNRLIQSWQAEKREQHNLEEHLNRFLDPEYDPYVALPSASGALGYFGHTQLAQRLLKRLEKGQATALLGLRKMGTSSTLRYLQDQARWPTALINLQAGLDLTTILANAIQEWQSSAQRKLNLDLRLPQRSSDTMPTHLNDSGETATDFATIVGRFVRQLRRSIGESSARLILLLDEIELLMPKANESDANLARYLTLTRLLKGLVQDGLLSLIIAGNDPLFNRTSLWGEHANPLYQLFQEQFLPPLSPKECSHMVRNLGRQVGLTYDQETLDLIARASGGHPFLARQLCSLAYQALGRAGPVPPNLIQEAAERFIRNPRTAAFLDDNGLWGYLGQPDLWGLMPGRANQAVLIDLAAAPQPLTAQELKEGPNPDQRAGAIFSLREQWVIRPVEPPTSPTRYEISFGLFRDWIALNRDKESPRLQLQQIAQEFLANSNFKIKTLESKGYTPWDFLGLPVRTSWRTRFEQPVYTAVVARQLLDDQAVLAIHEAALAHSPDSGVAFAVIDERPDDTAWLQIATLRARGFSLVLLPQTLLQDGRASQKERRLLHNHLNRTLGRGHNPFDVRSPVYDVLNFFGRQALADQMTARLVAAQPLALFGLRKMGKSSVLYYLRNRAPFPVALVDLQSETELQAIYHEILRGWSRSLYIKFDFEWPVPILPEQDPNLPAIFRDITTNLLDTLAQLTPAPRLGVFLDEIEQIVPRPKQFGLKLHQYLAFMRGLRGIIQESKQLALLVAGVDPTLNRISRYGDQQNPAYQLFQEIFLSPLSPQDCGQMVRNIGRQVGLHFPQTAIDVINETSGGHPFLARQLCSRASNELERAGQITAPLMRETVDTFIRNPQTAANLDENGMWGEVTRPTLWGSEVAAANERLLKQLAAKDAPLKTQDILGEDSSQTLEDAFYALQNRWVISKTRRKRGPTVYRITFGLFHRWIRRHFGLDRERDADEG